ncbi:unnamed protein product [Pleuronectes platessa]|uniref:Uncharacterized protein n=1 Tax=Pleuronectes platessa TaxID=8262 RepID=A0A9N7TG42_PLEPL|nr:unnamed protein product [Pleuronectes platessa]
MQSAVPGVHSDILGTFDFDGCVLTYNPSKLRLHALQGGRGGERRIPCQDSPQVHRRFSWLHLMPPCSAQLVLTYGKEDTIMDDEGRVNYNITSVTTAGWWLSEKAAGNEECVKEPFSS